MTGIHYDLCVIGGGINGAGIARDAAGRGLSVLLVEARDLGGATSSASSKMIHGGLRYLEFGQFGLVRKSLKEREILMRLAPHIVRPMEFVIPHEETLRPTWMIRTGLFLYDHLAGRRKLMPSRAIDLGTDPRGQALNPLCRRGFTYADCWVDDARLVVLNAMDAAGRGADVLTRTICTGLSVNDTGALWQIGLKNTVTGVESERSAAAVVNASGPWVRHILEQSGLAGPRTPHIHLVKGSHIVVPKLHDGHHAFTIPQPDGRVVFFFPYENDFSLIGTTETPFTGNPYSASADADEIDYLCAAANRSFKAQIKPADIVWSYSGVRPLIEDEAKSATAASRDYRLVFDRSYGPPILSVFGGKITTYRILAEQAVKALYGGKPWTAGAPLPGGGIRNADFGAFLQEQKVRYFWLPFPLLYRYARAYGTRMDGFLQELSGTDGLGRHYGDGLYEAEVRHLVENEWARTAEDVLWRRTKLGLHASAVTVRNLEEGLTRIASL